MGHERRHPPLVIPAKGETRMSRLAQRGAEGMVGQGTHCGTMSESAAVSVLNDDILRRPIDGPRMSPLARLLRGDERGYRTVRGLSQTVIPAKGFA